MCNARRPSHRFTLASFRARARRKAQGYAIKHNTRKAPALFAIGNGAATLDLRGLA